MDKKQELDLFKTSIDLPTFAAGYGFQVDRAESSRNCVVMRTANGDKIIITKKTRGAGEEWAYWCPHDDRDRGSILDFLQNRGGGDFYHVCKTLREWLGVTDRPPLDYLTTHKIRPIEKDRERVLVEWGRARFVREMSYLSERGIGAEALDLPAFKDLVKIDGRHNALFPHFDREGICGFEVKNRGFSGFSVGGEKGLWYSRASAAARVLAFCESAIDAISYYLLNPPEQGEELRVFSIGGAMNPRQPDLIRAAMEKAPEGARVMTAFDADEAGDTLAETVAALAPSSVQVLRAFVPIGMGKDWNDALKYEKGIVTPNYAPSVGHEHGKTLPPPDNTLIKNKRARFRGPRFGSRERN